MRTLILISRIALIKQIDKLFYELYELTPEEIAIVAGQWTWQYWTRGGNHLFCRCYLHFPM